MRKLVAVLVFCFFYFVSNACEVCGYGNAINAIGLLPQFSKSFIGVRYAYQTFTTTHPDDKEIEADRFMQFELNGRYVISNRLQCSFSLPYAINQQKGSAHLQSNGVGDITTFLTYTAIPTKNIGKSNLYHALQFVIGVKLPTGKYKNDFSSSTFNEHLYPGTGSWDFIPTLNYVINYKQIGINLDISAKLNSNNKLFYKMGNQRSGNFKLFYNNNRLKINLIPFLALGYLTSKADINASKEVPYTGGYEWNAQFGADVMYNKYLVGFQYLKPVDQKWNDGYSCHEAKFNIRFLYFFK